ncbi:VOC family protein [Actinoplanes sp. NPDC024001]|uniref:VOC family protein n=1 Tax=Actinoplanes sp. NPDC024001 TaxID=3154598 RepID=UPI0034104B71
MPVTERYGESPPAGSLTSGVDVSVPSEQALAIDVERVVVQGLGVAPLMVVRDVPLSVEFYRRLGFQPLVEWGGYAKLVNGTGILHLAAQGDPPPDRPQVALRAPDDTASAVAAAIVVQVANCRQACIELVAAGVNLLTEPVEPEWGGEVRAFLRDPDGHLVEINEALV